jgi:hypothetical protein
MMDSDSSKNTTRCVEFQIAINSVSYEFQFENRRKERKMNVDRLEEVTIQDLQRTPRLSIGAISEVSSLIFCRFRPFHI